MVGIPLFGSNSSSEPQPEHRAKQENQQQEYRGEDSEHYEQYHLTGRTFLMLSPSHSQSFGNRL
jgi:hypothetical protein